VLTIHFTYVTAGGTRLELGLMQKAKGMVSEMINVSK
jgi:hypothetical protein